MSTDQAADAARAKLLQWLGEAETAGLSDEALVYLAVRRIRTEISLTLRAHWAADDATFHTYWTDFSGTRVKALPETFAHESFNAARLIACAAAADASSRIIGKLPNELEES